MWANLSDSLICYIISLPTFTVMRLFSHISWANNYIIAKTYIQLFLIRFLHQTTTYLHLIWKKLRCSLFDFYIKPQHVHDYNTRRACCSLFDFYIKPQPIVDLEQMVEVVPYSISTSNHNPEVFYFEGRDVVPYSISTSNHNSKMSTTHLLRLFLIRFLHQTTTKIVKKKLPEGCSLFDFYIKPQHITDVENEHIVVPYSISTSNHNGAWRH